MSSGTPGKAFELAVAAIQRKLNPGSEVEHNVHIEDRYGSRRQFDVAIRGTYRTRPTLIVIECKDWGTPVGSPEIEAFIQKAENVGADAAVFASSCGFSDPAIRQARDRGMGLLSLLSYRRDEATYSIGTYWYAEVWRWARVTVDLDFVRKKPPALSFRAGEVLLRGLPVVNWFHRKLVTEYENARRRKVLNPIELHFSAAHAAAA